MTELTRRRFVLGSSIGVTAAAAGAMIGMAHLPAPGRAQAPAIELDGSAQGGPIVLHVRDAATGEVALLVGTGEVVYRDRELVGRLLSAARRAALPAGGR